MFVDSVKADKSKPGKMTQEVANCKEEKERPSRQTKQEGKQQET